MSKLARAAVYEGPRRISVRDIPFPPIGAGDLLLEVEISGVDGSEVHQYRGEFPVLNERAPLILGDEVVGRVVEIGDDAAAARGLSVGARICVESRWPCSGCRTCDAGQYYLCENNPERRGYGVQSMTTPGVLWGAHATHMYVPQQALTYVVPEALSSPSALLACSPLANGMAFVEVGGVSAADHVVIVGPGPQGLCTALAAVAKGASVTVVGVQVDEDRLALADTLGRGVRTYTMPAGQELRETVSAIVGLGGPVDVVVDAAGVPQAKELTFALPRPLGTVVNVAVSTPDVQGVDWNGLLRREIQVFSPVSHPHRVPEALQFAVDLGAQGIDLGTWVTATFPVESADEAYRTAGYETDRRPIKVAFAP